MWRFVLKENIRRLQVLAVREKSGAERQKLLQLVEEAKAELAEIDQASTPERARNDVALEYFAGRVVDDALELNGAQFGSLQIYDDSREHLMVLAQRNFRAPFLHHLALMKPGDGSPCGHCLADDTPAEVADVNVDQSFEPHRTAAREAGFQAVQAFPVRNGAGSPIAVLSTYFSDPRSFSRDDLHRMSIYTASVGSGLERHLTRR